MPGSNNPRRLVVEGIDDLYSVVGIMRAHTQWPADKEKAPVWINLGRSVSEILEPSNLRVFLKSTTIQTLGIMVDANTKRNARYKRLRDICIEFFPDMPADMPHGGLVVDNEDGRRLGAWIMPDNASQGGLEDFLLPLIPDGGRPLLQHVDKNISEVSAVAPFRQAHTRKALLYSWLALQDPPSQNPREALYSKALDPTLPCARPFADWFCKLYQLPRSS